MLLAATSAGSATSTFTLIMGVLGILLSLPCWIYFVRAVMRIYGFISSGQPTTKRTDQPGKRIATVAKEVFFHTEMIRKPAVAVAHWFVMVGFMIGAVVWFEAYIQTFAPHSGWPLLKDFALYHFAEEVLALGTVLGIIFLIAIRVNKGHRERLSRFYGSNAKAAFFVEGVILLEGLGMLLVKAAKIATFGEHSYSPWADFFTRHLANIMPSSPEAVSALALFKLLVGMVWLFIVARNIRWGVAWHRFLAFFNIFFRRNADGTQALGKMTPMVDKGEPVTLESLEDMEEEPTLGVGTLKDASWKMLLDSSTCTECGRCQEQCPAWHTAKPLSPKMLMTDIRDAAVANASYLQDPNTFAADESYSNVDLLKMVGEGDAGIIDPDVLWSCTNCGACVEQCPVDIEHIDHVANMRRFQVLAESDFPSELAGMFKNLENKGNPWGRNASERKSWIDEARRDGIEVPIFGEDITDFDDTEYLFWVGCAGTFDDDGKRTTRAVVELLHTAGVKFAVLSKGETCTGDPARRAGNEFLFQQLALENIENLNNVFDGVPKGQRKIITSCPHCFNTLRNEYPDFDGHYDVFHHTQLLNRLVRDGLLKPVPRTPENRKPITYHDPCFLGRHNKVFDPPRELVTAAGANLVEMDRNRNEGFCCGAGGARMFMEEKIGTRINENRAAEAIGTGAEEIAVGCPFCNTMMATGVKALSDKPKDAPVVKDVAQMLRDAVLVDGKLPTRNKPLFLETPKRVAKETTTTPAPTKPAAPSAATPAVPDSPAAPGTPAPKAPAAPAPGASVPAAPGAAAPDAPGATAPNAPIPSAPAAPGAAAPTPAAPSTPTAPGSTAPVPGTSVPAAPGAAAPAAPGVATPTPAAPKTPAPGAAAPGASAPVPPKAPAAATPVAPQTPTAPAAPAAPGSVAPAPGASMPAAPGAAAPKAPIPSAPAAPGVAAPGASAPKPPKAPAAAPAAPGTTAPNTPIPSVPTAPGSAAPTPAAPSAPATPGTSAPKIPAPGAAAPGAAAPGASAPVPPKAPDAVVPGGTKEGQSQQSPVAPGGAIPPVPGAPGTVAPENEK